MNLIGANNESSPGDGYRVERYDSPTGSFFLNLYFMQNGERQWNKEIGKWLDDNPACRGARERLYWLWNAFCHYLNSGGTLDYLRELQGFAFGKLIDVDDDVDNFELGVVDNVPNVLFELPEIRPPEGYCLLHTEPYEDDFSRFEHVFVEIEGDGAIIWSEDLDVRKTRTTTLLSEIAEMEEALPNEQITGIQCEPDSADEGET